MVPVKSLPTHHCTMLPSGEFNGMFLAPLHVHSESFTTQYSRFIATATEKQTNTREAKQYLAAYFENS